VNNRSRPGGSSNIKYAGGSIAILGALIVIIGSIMPWAKAASSYNASTTGISGNGKITLVCGIIMILGALLMLAFEKAWLGSLLVVVAAVPAIVLGIKEIIDVGTLIYPNGAPEAEAGLGLYLVVAGAAMAVLGGLSAMVTQKT
jgi:hypothetical protein